MCNQHREYVHRKATYTTVLIHTPRIVIATLIWLETHEMHSCTQNVPDCLVSQIISCLSSPTLPKTCSCLVCQATSCISRVVSEPQHLQSCVTAKQQVQRKQKNIGCLLFTVCNMHMLSDCGSSGQGSAICFLPSSSSISTTCSAALCCNPMCNLP